LVARFGELGILGANVHGYGMPGLSKASLHSLA
jgi:hypothetical protein